MRTILLFILLFPLLAYSQIQRKFSSYTADDGLNQNSIYEILQDHRGYLWFSTANGISRFDGNEIHNYKFDPKNNNSIDGEFYFMFFEDSKKQLWVSHDKGLSLYDRIKDQFINIIKSKTISTYNILTEDENQRLWLLISNKQLVGFDINKKQIVKNIKLDTLKSTEISIQKNPYYHNKLLVFQNKANSLYIFNTATFQLQKLNAYGIRRVEFASYTKNKFIAIDALQKNIVEYQISNGKVSSKQQKINTNGNANTTCITYSNGKYYLGTIDGYYIIDKDNYNNIEYHKNFGQYAQSFTFMESLYRDKTGNIIFGTNGIGIKILSPHVNKFIHIGSNEERLNMTKSILVTKSGKIFVGLHALGFLIYDEKDNYNYKHILFKPKKSSDLVNASVLGMIEYSDQEILLMYNDRMIVYNYILNKIVKEQNSKFYEPQAYPSFENHKNKFYINTRSLPTYFISNINEDLSTQVLYQTKDTAIINFKHYNDSILLIGTNKTFIIYNLITKKKIYVDKEVFVKSILITSKKEIYFSTIRGLFKVNLKGEVLEKYDENSGMRNDNIYGLLEDNNGNIWFSHNRGLTLFKPSSKQFKNFSTSDGLQSNEFNTGSYHKGRDGKLYFGGTNGVNIINPSNIHYNPYPPNISLNKIYLFDIPYKTDTNYNELTSIKLNYTENTLAFDFSALDFSNPSANKYKYILEGYDKKIIESGNRHYARYANLPAGNYVLKLFGSNNDGVWCKEPKIIYISIIPPYWQTTWFYWLTGLSAILIFIGIIYYYIHRQKQALKRKLQVQYELEQERLRIARDLHDNVGAHLSYLISNLDWMISHPEKLSEEEEKKRLENLTETGRQAILTLRQTIWAINNQALFIEDFADKFKTFARKMLEFSTHININFKEEFNSKRKLNPGVTLHLFRICQEALSNILKHAKASNINVLFKSDEKYLFYFKITDDGKGFDTTVDYSDEHYGLVIMSERAAECGAIFTINSSLNNGTTIELKIEN